MNLSNGELEILRSDMQRIGIFIRLNTNPIVRIWLGVGRIDVGVNSIDTAGAAYSGMGQITDVPQLKQLINGQAERVEFTLSGISPEIMSVASEYDARTVKDAECDVGFAVMTPDWELIGSIKWLRRYRADFLSVKQQSSDDPAKPAIRSVTLSVGSLTTGVWRPAPAYFTDQDQQSRSSGDRFCERTVLYSQEQQKVWPRF